MAIPRDVLKDWRVLIIDDEPDSLEVVGRMLRYYGAEVSVASNGQEGLAALKVTRPTLVISDLSMPNLDGWGLIAALKRERPTMDIPVIALTAHAMPGDRERALGAGFHNYLSKPLTPATFLKDLLRLLVDVPEFSAALKEILHE
jgi:CheY-like chemotaxis protein